MRLALLSDLHGNSIALDAVLADIDRRGGADHHWVLGDLVALGHDPIGVLERITALPGAAVVRGQHGPLRRHRGPPAAVARSRGPAIRELVPVITEVAATFAWTAGNVARRAAGCRWLAALPDRGPHDAARRHAAARRPRVPGSRRRAGHQPRRHRRRARVARLAGCDADVVFAGHTHWPVDRATGSIRAVNLGSISNPLPPDLRASYVIVEANETGHTIEHVRVDYDHDAVIAALEALQPSGSRLVDQRTSAAR